MYKIYRVKKILITCQVLDTFLLLVLYWFDQLLYHFQETCKFNDSTNGVMRVNYPLNVITYFPNLSLSSLLKKVLKYFFKGNIE